MPTSNGQVTSRDIRQQAIKTLHILDDAVATAKIPNLAVTFPDKIDDPIWATTAISESYTNASLTTTPQEIGSLSVAVPAWVDQVAVFALADIQIGAGSTSPQGIVLSTRIDDSNNGANQHDVTTGTTINLSHPQSANLVGVAGSTFTVNIYAWTSTGTNSSSNNGRVHVVAVGTR